MDERYQSPGSPARGVGSQVVGHLDEARVQLRRPPRAGARVQSFSALVDVGSKVIERRQWAFDLDTGAVLLARSSVMLAFDLSARRSMEIPSEVRASLEADCQPDLR